MRPKPQMLFIVGREGTGHHGIVHIVADMAHSANRTWLRSRKEHDQDSANGISKVRSWATKMVHMPPDKVDSGGMYGGISHSYPFFIRRAHEAIDTNDRDTIFNKCRTMMDGMYDIVGQVQAAHNAGVDVKVIVTHRPYFDSIFSHLQEFIHTPFLNESLRYHALSEHWFGRLISDAVETLDVSLWRVSHMEDMMERCPEWAQGIARFMGWDIAETTTQRMCEREFIKKPVHHYKLSPDDYSYVQGLLDTARYAGDWRVYDEYPEQSIMS